MHRHAPRPHRLVPSIAVALVLTVALGLGALPATAATDGDDGGTAPDAETEQGTLPISPRIVGGTKAPDGAWPSQVALVFADTPENYYAQFCGGTIISWSWVLTAAHCVRDIGDPGDPYDDFSLVPSDLEVLVGTQDLAEGGGGTRVAVAEIRIHPAWDPYVGRNDLALLRLDDPAPSGTKFQAITAQNVSPVAGTDVVVTGWGTQEFGTPDYPTDLMQVTLDVATSTACGNAYPGFYQQSTMVCAERLGKDSCQGDSGGPLVENRGGSWVQVGIVSTGFECARAGYPGIYTRVAAFSNWIKQQIRYGAHADANVFVKQVHRDAFNREPSATELYSGVAALVNGQTPEAYANGIVGGSTYQTRTGGVIRLYQAIFLRRPDTAGLQYWWVQVNRGTSLKRIADIMVNASEFDILYGDLDDAEFVTLVYRNVLGRTPAAFERDYWVGELTSGVRSRGQVMVGFSESPEYKAATADHVKVIGAYFALLRRVPSKPDIEAWSASSQQAIISAMVKGREYADRF